MDLICHNLLLADDDMDDCMFFKEALADLGVVTTLATVSDGVELMQYLSKNQANLPDLVFLDLNMPRKTGYECLAEIRQCETYRDLPVIIVSTSFDPQIVNLLFEKGAHHYIRKPADFHKLKKLIYQAITVVGTVDRASLTKEDFIIDTA